MAEKKEQQGHGEEPVSFNCVVLTPQKRVFSGQVESMYLPAALGDLEILPRREPLLTPLKSGIVKLRVMGADGAVDEQTLALHGGFLDMNGIEATIFATAAEAASEIDLERVKESEHRARERLESVAAKHGDYEHIDMDRAKLALARAILRMQVAGRGQQM